MGTIESLKRSGLPNPQVREYQRFREALKKAVRLATEGDTKGIDRLAKVVVGQALSGEPWALHMIADRLDGKPAQSVNLTNAQGTYVIMIPSATETAQAWEQSIVAEQHQAIATVPAAEPVAPPKADELP